MTRWDGVLIGVLVALVVEAVAFLVWGRLTLFGGLVGSGVAGYVAGDELTDGEWHGLLAALAWGIVVIPASVLVAIGGAGRPLFPTALLASYVGSPGALTTVIVLGVTLPNLLAGAVGSAVRWRFGVRPRP